MKPDLALGKAKAALENLEKWFKTHVVPLAHGHNAQVGTWEAELEAARDLLKSRPKVRIALVGTTGAGKSTFLNALLGQEVLPVGVMQPCTAFVTAVRRSDDCDYHLSVDFVTADEWRSELETIVSALRPGDEDDPHADSRWALAWFDQQGFAEGEYGIAETLSTAKNTSVSGLVEAGILSSSRGKVRLLKPNELPSDWDPEKDKRLTVWETVHHLIRALEAAGEPAAAALVAKLGTKAEVTRELACRLYTLCERKKRATEALAYNGILQSWPEIVRLAKESTKPAQQEQAELFASKGGK